MRDISPLSRVVLCLCLLFAIGAGVGLVGPVPLAAQEDNCDNGRDDDDDGMIDCFDSDCDGASCDDGFDCTINDRCDFGSGDPDKCVGQNNHTFCRQEDGLFCNGQENCNPNSPLADPETGCVDRPDPCTDPGETCNESQDRCVEVDCEDGNDNDGDGPIDCNDSDCPCPSGTTCHSSSGQCRETACADGIDNDGDGDVDCADGNCNGQPCSDGAACTDDTGKTCGGGVCPTTGRDHTFCDNGQFCDGSERCNPDSGAADSDGCVDRPDPCTDPGEACSESEDRCVEVDCTDGINNDAPDGGFIDCEDTDCACAAGAQCGGSPPRCVERLCTDGIDNDGDGLTDCEDPNCTGRACSDGVPCTDDSGSTCPGGGSPCPPGTPVHASCQDGLFCNGNERCNPSNASADSNGCVDRPDPCDPAAGQGCDETNDTCTETACNDGLNNDGPDGGLIDCNDPDCPCPAGTTCHAVSGECRESACADGIDNDGDTAVDCADTPDCNGNPCSDGLSCTDDSGSTCGGGVCPTGTPVNANCDDGQFCNGRELCRPNAGDRDPVTGCVTRNVPCQSPGVGCDEASDDCIETACQDDLDNDGGDGPDCLDLTGDCACPPGTRCDDQIGSPTLSDCLEDNCGDGVDNDGDGQVDCADPDCDARPCDDGASCTDDTGKTCTGGRCPFSRRDDTRCDDGVLCNGTESCDPTDPNADPDTGCVAVNPLCTDPGEACDPETGNCIETDCDDGINNDGNEGRDCRDPDCPCPAGTQCDAPGDALCHETNCGDGLDNDNDGLPDCLDPDCYNTNAPCNDGFSCTTNDQCTGQPGVCEGSQQNSRCNDGFFCTVDICDPQNGQADPDSGCVNDPRVVRCDDSLDCTTDSCDPDDPDAGSDGCVHDTANGPCDDGKTCTEDTCDAVAGCINTPTDANCDDGATCTRDVCNPTDGNADPTTGCVITPQNVCGDGVDCTDDSCDPTDANADGTTGCVNDANDANCDDGFSCTTDTCDPVNDCQNDPDDSQCDNGLFCDGSELCAPGLGSGPDGCNPGTPRCTDSGESCNEDEDRCVEEECRDGVDNDSDGNQDCGDPDCPGFTPEDCDDGQDNDCDLLVDCDDTADCVADADGDGHEAEPCGQDCNDADPTVNPGRTEDCTTPADDDCDGLTNCADPDCQVDADNDGQVAAPCGEDCDDTDPNIRARRDEICDNRVDDDCDGLTDCADGECAGRACDDGAACTTGDICSAGACVGTPNDLDCDDGVFCTRDRCVVGVGCESSPRDARCDNGLFCDGSERCDPLAAGADGDGCVDGPDPCGNDDCNEVDDACDCAPDGFEPDDLCGQARPVNVDNQLRSEAHSICPVGDIDRITFPVTEGVTYTFFTTGDVDTLGTITDAGCVQQLARNNDCSPGDANFCLSWTAGFTGQAVLAVRSGAGQPARAKIGGTGGAVDEDDALEIEGTFGGDPAQIMATAVGPYTLWFQSSAGGGCTTDGFEPGDDACGTATFITPTTSPSTEGHTLCPPGDVDRWRFRGEAGMTYRFQTAGGTDTFMEIRSDDCGLVLQSSGDCSGDPNACLEFSPTVTAFYVVEVRGQTSAVTGAYQFTHSKLDGGGGGGGGCDEDAAEPDDGCDQATSITVTGAEQSMARSLCPEGDRDTFRFFAQAGKVYKFSTTGGVDTRILIGNDTCTQVLRDESSCGPDAVNACAFWRAPSSGFHKVRVEGRFPSITGDYVFRFVQADCPPDGWEPDNGCGQSTSLNVTTELKRQAHTICPGGENDLFEFFAQQGMTYRFFSRGSTDTGGAVLDPNCQKFLKKDESSGDGENFDLRWTAPQSGLFKFGVTGDGGPYDFFYQKVVDPGTACTEDPAEQDDVCSAGTVIVPSTSEQALDRTLCPPDDRDHFTFQASAGVTYEFYTTGDTDTTGNVRDASCTKLMGNDDCNLPTDLNFCFTWTAPSDGTYHVRVRGFSRTQTVGEYRLHYRIVP